MTKLSPPELDITKLPDRCQALLDEMHEETGISREILLSVMLTVKAASVQDTHEVELSGGQRTSLQIYMSWMQCTNNSLRTLSKAGVRNY